MNPTPALRDRMRIRSNRCALLVAVVIVMGLIAAVAGWGSSQRDSPLVAGAPVSAGTPPQVSADSGHPAVDPAPVCRKQETPAPIPAGTLATPPRVLGDQLVADCVGLVPEFRHSQQISIGKQPRAPTLPVAAPHLTTVLII
ncbi:hypothetical protein [Nocardia yunnanensis]|uniref:hypothetical protein n=1 Tax=Nocardia yunnanensis TaxID=2382165 RepID=UPI0013C466D6|nr:hypothetical protein [Nocardia yunnanensis]